MLLHYVTTRFDYYSWTYHVNWFELMITIGSRNASRHNINFETNRESFFFSCNVLHFFCAKKRSKPFSVILYVHKWFPSFVYCLVCLFRVRFWIEERQKIAASQTEMSNQQSETPNLSGGITAKNSYSSDTGDALVFMKSFRPRATQWPRF